MIEDAVVAYERGKFKRLMDLCKSPIELTFLSSIYYFFVKLGFSILNETICLFRRDFEARPKIESFANLLSYGHRASQGRSIVVNPLTGEPEVLLGFNVKCIDVIYTILPQFPVYDAVQMRYADFVIEVQTLEGVHLKDFIIECDGFTYHSSREQMANDYIRTRFLTKHSYTVIRYTSDEINKMSDRFLLNLENCMYHAIYKRNSNLFISKSG